MKKQEYTLIIVTENNIGLLNRITVVFTRRKLNIDSITASESKLKDIYSYTIVLHIDEDLVQIVAKQIEKIIGVYKVFIYTEKEIVHQELALYKLTTNVLEKDLNLEQIVRKYNARILSMNSDYILIEKTGHKKDTEELLRVLEPFGVLQFIRSGRVAMAKPMKPLEEYLFELENTFMN
jgi:acetolactate synthase-1/3 small subunit